MVGEGMISLIDLISRSYLKLINPKVWLLSGIQNMPLVGEDWGLVLRVISVTGATLYPLALSLLLPIFMYTIVLEKEEKILEMMKMNGMRMREYWLITFLFNFFISVITFGVFFLFGRYLLKLDFFTDTSIVVLVIIDTLPPPPMQPFCATPPPTPQPQIQLVIFLGWSLA